MRGWGVVLLLQGFQVMLVLCAAKTGFADPLGSAPLLACTVTSPSSEGAQEALL
jgi:hypothetical protein